ncbi:lipopolysaccharide biosynthesis protein [Noviherbaspirillum sp.]|uniref:lipopolysaccharide biosynthesis protein n=1 Tax=Noviherbaspirillum sp. TaxID=1926288 RepID=UPI002FE1A7AB
MRTSEQADATLQKPVTSQVGRLASDFVWVASARLVAAVVALAAVRLSTSLLSPGEYGLLAMLVTFQVFCGLFLINPVGQYINRHTHAWADDRTLLVRLRRYRRWVFFAAFVGAAATTAWALRQPLTGWERSFVACSVLVMVVAATWNATSVSLLNMLGHRREAAAWSVATALLGLGSSYFLATWIGGGTAWFAGQALGMAAGAIGSGYAARRALPPSRTGQWTLLEPGALSGYVLPLAFATGCMWWLFSGHRIMLEFHWGLSALGYVAVGLMVASQLWALAESQAMQFLFPMFYRRISGAGVTDRGIAYSDLVNTLVPVYLVLASAAMLAAPSLVLLLVDPKYSGVVFWVLIGTVIECCRALGNLIATAAQAERRMPVLMLPYSAGAAVLTVGLVCGIYFRATIMQATLMIACAGVITLCLIAFAMLKILALRPDAGRWIAAMLLLALSAYWTLSMPITPAGKFEALAVLVNVGVLSAVTAGALLWKNAGLARLLAVRLRSA